MSHGLQRQLGFWVGVALLFHPLAVFSADTSNSVVISTSLSLRSDHQPELACDGRDDTWFLSFRPARDGDDFLLTLPAPAQLTGVTVTTGTGDGENRLEYGSLETSVDGSNFTFAAAFVHGDARVTGLKEPVRAVRLRVTGQGRAPLAIREFTLHSPTPLPKARLMTRVEVDYSATPECAFFARRAKALAEEWYPRIGEVLWKGAMPARFSVVKLHFVPGKIKDFIGYTTGNGTIMIAADWVMTHTPRDYGLVIHELTHVVQAYGGGGEGWLTEGIADYIRDYVFEPGVRKPEINADKATYRDGYLTTAAFLDWLQRNKSADLIVKLNEASYRHQPTISLFRESTGEEMDQLWKEFLASLTSAPKK